MPAESQLGIGFCTNTMQGARRELSQSHGVWAMTQSAPGLGALPLEMPGTGLAEV